MSRPIVFLEFTVSNKKVGRVEIELYSDIVPKTAENFRALCTGEKGHKGGKPLHYKNCKVHRIEPGFCIQSGDILKGNGTGGRSIYESGKLEDENFLIKHDCPGIISMANSGPNTSSSQFFFTMSEGPLPQLDGKHVAFGKVISGFEVLKGLEQYGNRLGNVDKKVVISDCGQVEL
ncbi:hypothetical protein ABK040_014448 [Willaertia magna]